jgi:uncharacterized protein
MKIHSLHIYPLKSGRVIDLADAQVGAWGLEGDRRYMLADPYGKFITQRELTSLAQVEASVVDEHLVLKKGDKLLAVTFDATRRRDVDIWGSVVSAALAAADVNAALSEWFERPVELVYADNRTLRACSTTWAGGGVETGFADGYPILITTTGSLAALNAETKKSGHATYGMDRFRPNIVLDHDEAFAEDHWAALEIAGIRFDLVKPCARCIMTTQDQLSGERGGPDPMPAMRSIRMSADRRVPGVLFGWNVVVRGTGRLKIGDEATVVKERPEGWPIKQRSF